jgi:hypothetical protein
MLEPTPNAGDDRICSGCGERVMAIHAAHCDGSSICRSSKTRWNCACRGSDEPCAAACSRCATSRAVWNPPAGRPGALPLALEHPVAEGINNKIDFRDDACFFLKAGRGPRT